MSIWSRLSELEHSLLEARFEMGTLKDRIEIHDSIIERLESLEKHRIDDIDHLTDVTWNEKETSRAVKLILDHLGFEVERVKELFRLVKKENKPHKCQ